MPRKAAATYEGKPCIHGHGTLRYVIGRKCVTCRHITKLGLARAAAKAEAEASRGAAVAAGLKTFLGLPCHQCANRERYVANTHGCTACTRIKTRRQQHENPEKEKARQRARKKVWRRDNPDKAAAHRVRHRARRQAQLCSCCQPKEFIAAYREARLRGCEVDHRLPLWLGGKHCIKNLHILTPEEHQAKTVGEAWLRNFADPASALRKALAVAPTGLGRAAERQTPHGASAKPPCITGWPGSIRTRTTHSRYLRSKSPRARNGLPPSTR